MTVVVKDSGYFFVPHIIWIFKTTFYPTDSIKVKKNETILIRVSKILCKLKKILLNILTKQFQMI